MSKEIITNLLSAVGKLKQLKDGGMDPATFNFQKTEQIEKITNTLSNMLGAETSSTATFHGPIKDIVTDYVNHVKENTPLNYNDIYIKIFKLGMSYSFALFVALIMDADIPFASTVAGVYHLANKTCNNIEQMETFFHEAGIGFITQIISFAGYGCIPMTVLNEAGHLVIEFWSFILSFAVNNHEDIMKKIILIKEIIWNPTRFKERIQELFTKLQELDLKNLHTQFKNGELQNKMVNKLTNMKNKITTKIESIDLNNINNKFNTMKDKIKNNTDFKNFQNAFTGSKNKIQTNEKINTLMGHFNEAMGKFNINGLSTKIKNNLNILKEIAKDGKLPENKVNMMEDILKKFKLNQLSSKDTETLLSKMIIPATKQTEIIKPLMNNVIGRRVMANAVNKAAQHVVAETFSPKQSKSSKGGKGKYYKILRLKQTNKKRKTYHHKKNNKYTKNTKRYKI